ncbi:uncharacterized protein LOC113378031 isoform X2 [Ctenocephalides felis]|nr:uncharacterized protein LOC113378031 isoform X2 [Ctenocephalides felis]XP_026474319.1 uncharacterized protein LOC113378031 isoform X2 [Ctenocephalides felis]XP_026474320.1 uncharacterized protein LOC113378031 isoform X2 [Ctenocephalides felis]XP_026474322.1 uncharacterized protein LOC113378031 isoform X2 [Ctenocephalides felis]XP_026474323.1 uncharacterized protein LOC113378031 isoform X2 [Ctenocephalides felis]XP_026474324.1 uncharacterized protein LOC113378031 isoform X2 [Ctenocephalides 
MESATANFSEEPKLHDCQMKPTKYLIIRADTKEKEDTAVGNKKSSVYMKKTTNIRRSPFVSRFFPQHGKPNISEGNQSRGSKYWVNREIHHEASDLLFESMDGDNVYHGQKKDTPASMFEGQKKSVSILSALSTLKPSCVGDVSSEDSECELPINSWADVVNALKLTMHSSSKEKGVNFNACSSNAIREDKPDTTNLRSLDWHSKMTDEDEDDDDNENFCLQSRMYASQDLNIDTLVSSSCNFSPSSSSRADENNTESLKRKRVHFKLPPEIIFSTDSNKNTQRITRNFIKQGGNRHPKRFKGSWLPTTRRPQCGLRAIDKPRYNTYDTDTETETEESDD